MVAMDLRSLISKSYNGKKVFLTGHTGFKGTWLLSWLHALEADIKGYSLDPFGYNDLYNLIDGDDLCNSTIADIRDKERIRDEIINFEPDFIFHLAAQPLVRDSYLFPVTTFETNIIGTANVLDAVRDLNKNCTVIIITTDKVYHNNEWNYPYRETDSLGGYDPYSSSKACCELVVDSYRSSFFNLKNIEGHRKALATARAGNVIGGGDRAKDRLIPDIIRAVESGRTISVRNPFAVRPWQHVLEPLYGYLLLGAKLSEQPNLYSGSWNFGPYNEDVLSVEDIVKIAIGFYGDVSYQIAAMETQEPHEASLLKLDISKAVNDLGWQPKWNTQEAIQKSLDWYKRSLIESPYDLVQEQIRAY
jgi:CDP-glucose 4,6-dehydratase